MKRNVALLAVCQALFMTSNVVLVSASALVGLALAPSATLATVPLGLQFIANMAAVRAMPFFEIEEAARAPVNVDDYLR